MLRTVEEGKPQQQNIELFYISRATIERYLKQRRELGHVHSRALPGHTLISLDGKESENG